MRRDYASHRPRAALQHPVMRKPRPVWRRVDLPECDYFENRRPGESNSELNGRRGSKQLVRPARLIPRNSAPSHIRRKHSIRRTPLLTVYHAGNPRATALQHLQGLDQKSVGPQLGPVSGHLGGTPIADSQTSNSTGRHSLDAMMIFWKRVI